MVESMSGVCRASGLKASGCEWKVGDDVGREKASCVDERACPFLEYWSLSAENQVESQPMVCGGGKVERKPGLSSLYATVKSGVGRPTMKRFT